ncbi:MAG TPA: A/G-specific adenine glycosylase [Anaerolineaceae bacterium]|nr:A/G-specific adenine glycosylase [Anaerolineaceae bacterium]
MTHAMKEELSRLLLNWYKQNARVLPWRGHTDPYAIWVSEIMLQQTRVDTVIPYYLRWLKTFPDIPTLAAAGEDEVLKAWEGLGYYARARALHRAARQLAQENGSRLPEDFGKLLKLPGIGLYTAAAIASIAFGLDHAVVDGNVKRVLARLLPYTQPVNTPAAESELRQLAHSLLPAGMAGDYNQALMEIGALVCLPRNPLCADCPLTVICAAFNQGRQDELPVMKEKAPIPHLEVTAGILRRNGRVLIAKRPADGLLGGLWEFPGGKVEEGETRSAALSRELVEELGITVQVEELFGTYRHAYTHFKVTLYAYTANILAGAIKPLQHAEVRWVSQTELEDYPMGKIDRMISRDLLNAVS